MYYFSLVGQQTELSKINPNLSGELIDLEPNRLHNGELVAVWTPPVSFYVETLMVMRGSKVAASVAIDQKLIAGRMVQFRYRFSLDHIGQKETT